MRAALSLLVLSILPALSFASPSSSDDVEIRDYIEDDGEIQLGVLTSNASLHGRTLSEDQDYFSVGLMMPRHDDFGLAERDLAGPRGAVEEWSNFHLERDVSSGEFNFPKSYSEAKRMLASQVDIVKRKASKAAAKLTVRVTWYSGHDLANPSCGDWRLGGKWSPTGNNMICALTATWSAKGGKPQCGSFLKLTTPNKKSIVVRVVDSCSGSAMSPSNSCTKGMKVVDLTQTAFSKLASLNKGIIDGVTVSVIPKPGGARFSKSDVRLYGPLHF